MKDLPAITPPDVDIDEAYDDEEIEKFSESLRSFENHNLTQEFSKLYHRLRILGEEERITPVSDNERKESLMSESYSVKRKIGAVEEEIGRRKKENAWNW